MKTQFTQYVSAEDIKRVLLSCSVGHRAAGCLSGSGVPPSPQVHGSSGESVRAAALGGQVRQRDAGAYCCRKFCGNY